MSIMKKEKDGHVRHGQPRPVQSDALVAISQSMQYPLKKQKSQPQPATAQPSAKLTQEALASFRNFERRMYSEYQQMQKGKNKK